MDLLSLAVLGITALVCSVAGIGIGTRRGRRTPAFLDYQELEIKNKNLRGKNGNLKVFVETAERRYRFCHQDLQKVLVLRDQYRKIAESHDLKMPVSLESPAPTNPLWKNRRYCGHPETNLATIEEDLRAAGVWDKEIHLGIEILGSALGGGTGFSKAIRKLWSINGNPTKDIGPLHFQGPGERVVADLKTFLRDDSTGLTKQDPRSKSLQVWVDEDSPLVFKIDVDTVEPYMPEIQIIEVAVVEERIVERIVEKIVEKKVFISTPKNQEPGVCSHTSEEIQGLVDEAFARKVADEEVERISGPPADVRRRLAQAKGAKQGGKA